MTIFDGAKTTPSAPVVPETPEAILAEVTTKFKTDKGELDVAALAKGKLEADRFIERLTKEQDALRQDLNSRAQLEELIQDLRKAREDASKTPLQEAPKGSGQPNAPETALTVEAVKELFKEELSQTQKQVLAQRNIDIAEAELAKQWGASTRSKLETRAAELDVSLDFLKGLAASKPKAFLEMVGAKPPVQVNTQDYAPPSTRDNPAHREQPKGRTKSYYDKMRKENPTEYWSVRIQGQEDRDALAQGEAFFDTKD